MFENLLPFEFPYVYIFDIRKTNSFWKRGVFEENLQRNASNFNVLEAVRLVWNE
jgi:hypothetical protein